MGIICIMPDLWQTVDNNYSIASKIYESKKEAILNKLKEEQYISGQDFINEIQSNYSILMHQKYTSEVSGREVSLDTILNHLYKAAEAIVTQVLEDHKNDGVEQQIKALREISRQSGANIAQEKKAVEKEIDRILQDYSNETQIDRLVYEMLPKYMSSGNQQLSASQVYAYTKSMLKREIQRRASIEEIDKAVKKHPSIILGYIREDAIANAALKAIEQLQMIGAKAQTVGKEQSTIDIIIPLTGRASTAVSKGGEVLKDILTQLDTLGTSFVVEGESQYDTAEFLGIQSKPWRLYLPTTEWNRNSVGSRADLLKGYKEFGGTMSPPETLEGWHRGVLYLSYNLQQIIGPNTVMYATGGSLIWTSELLEDMYSRYHKYFAFMLDSNHNLTSHIQIADHYG